MNRREFLSWVGVGWVASSLPVAIAATTTVANAQTTRINVGTLAQLDERGFLSVKRPKKVIVIRDPSDSTKLLARTANCNHRNCMVNWASQDVQFRCPCHNSRFVVDGHVVRGPATQALSPLTVTVEGPNVIVTA
jgi:cytochrome b6-f complex iron-sulfur subunit